MQLNMRGCEQMTGLSPDTVEARPFWELFKPFASEDSVPWRATLDIAARGGEFLVSGLTSSAGFAGTFAARFR